MSSLRLQDKVAIVTGSSSGIGREICLYYAREGAKVVCADLTLTPRKADNTDESTHSAINEAGGKAIFVQTDVGDPEQVQRLVAAAVTEYGRLDV